MDPDEGGQPGMMGGRVLGMPVILVVLVVAVGAYFLFFRNKGSAAGADTTSTGAQTVTTGPVTLQKGAVRVSVNGEDDQDQPQPPTTGRKTTISVPNVVGMRGEAAQDTLSKAGLKPKQVPSSTPKGQPTTVTSENPKAASKVKRNSVVTTHVELSAHPHGGNS